MNSKLSKIIKFNLLLNCSISLSSSMWPIDNNELIDIASNPINTQIFEISNQVKIYRDEEEIKIEKIFDNNESKEKITDNEDAIKLGEIQIKNSKYYYKPNLKESFYPNLNETNNSNNNTEFFSWLIYKSNKVSSNHNKYKLKEGDVIKIGREILFIKEIYISKKTKKKLKIKSKEKIFGNKSKYISYHSQTNKDLNINDDCNIIIYHDTDEDKDEEIKCEKNKFETENEETKRNVKHKESIEKNSNNKVNNKSNNKVKICRICYIEEYDKLNNPLIKPCKCSGSMKYIHYECLLHWIKTKIIVETSSPIYSNDFLSVYILGILECELCKSKFPNYIRHKNEIYSLLDLDKKFDEDIIFNKKGEKVNLKRNENKNNYIIFDSVSSPRTDHRFRYIVKFDENNIIKIGRGLDMQFILNDISVSRNHCQLKIEEDGSIVLEDNNSKFGSLVLIQQEIEILRGISLNIQVGTNYLNFVYKKKSGFFSCCKTDEIDKINSYEKMNSRAIKYDKIKEILDESISQENSEKVEENNNEAKKEEEIKKNGLNNKKEEEKNEDELIIFDKDKIFKNKRNNEENNHFESTYNISTLMLKENKTQDRLNILSNNSINNCSNNNIDNMKKIRRDINEMNREALDGIRSENIIVSEDEESKSNKSKINNEN